MPERITAANIKEVFISENQLQKRIGELADQIADDYQGKELLMICILKGASAFFVDLTRELGRRDFLGKIDFIGKASYGSQITSSGEVKTTMSLESEIEGKDVLVIEDIIDTGRTLSQVLEELSIQNPASLKACVLLDKWERREVEVDVDYTGFKIPDKFVVGYYLDYDGDYRGLPYIGVL